MLYGQQLTVAHGVSTVLADFDFETYSEAGYVWLTVPGYWTKAPKRKPRPNEIRDESGYWMWVEETVRLASLPNMAKNARGLKVVGARNYVEHETFEVLRLAYNLKDGLGKRHWIPGMPAPLDLWAHVQRRLLLEAWNVEFELTVWNYHLVPKHGWPALDMDQLRCCMAKAAAWSMPRGLGNAGAVLKLVTQKDPAGDALIRKLTVPRNPTRTNPARRWTRETAPQDFARFDLYNDTDIVSEAEASSRIPDLSPRELEIWKVDQRVNQRGMQIDLKGVADCVAIVEQATEKYNAELRAITGGRVEKSSAVADTLGWLRTRGVYLPGLDEDTVVEQLTLNHADDVKRVLKIRELTAFGSVKKLYAMQTQACADGRLRGQYAYCSALTHLWNSQGVQVANLYKGTLNTPEEIERALAAIGSRSLDYVEGVYGDALMCVANCLRSMIVAAPGHRLIASDYNSIQAVVTSFLAGEPWRMEVFRTHGKMYEATASIITGKPLQFYLDYRKQTGKHHEDRNPFGKIPTLASDFGGWIGAWKKFGASQYMNDEQIKAAILKLRAGMPMIVELWGGQTRNKFRWDEAPEYYGLEGAAIRAVLEPGKCFGYRNIRYMVHDDVLYCQPPGNCSPLSYHEPRLKPASRDYSRPWELELSFMGWDSKVGWARFPLYGGVLTQNVVAKVSREFQADSLVRCERSGLYLPVMHTHDEIVTEVPLGLGSTDEYLKLINVPREGCMSHDNGEPWPVRAPSADETYRYGKWE